MTGPWRRLAPTILLPLLVTFATAAEGDGAAPAIELGVGPTSPAPFSSVPAQALLAVVAIFGALGVVRGLLPPAAKARWIRSVFAHALRLGWLALVPAFLLDGLFFFLGNEYSHAWVILAFTLAGSPFVAGLQWEKPWWNARKRREEPYVPALNYYLGLFLVAWIPALIADALLSWLAGAGRLSWVLVPLNLLCMAAIAGTAGFCAARLVRLLLTAIIFPNHAIRFFVHPASRFYAIILVLALVGMTAFNYMTLPFFLEVIGYTIAPWPAITLDQALIILVPNLVNVICVTYFSIFAGCFISMLPVILFSRSLRKTPEPPPALDVLLSEPELSKAYLGRELTAAELWPTIVTITAYNEPAEPLEKTLYGYLKVAREWVSRGLPLDRYVILFSHQTEREEERLEFEAYLAEHHPALDPRGLIERDWARFDEDNPTASIKDESKLEEALSAWLSHKKLAPDSKAGRSEREKRRVCQRMYEFSCHAPRALFRMPDPPRRVYGPQVVDSWIWYYLIPKQVEGRLLQVTSKAHNLYYAREAIWGEADSSPLRRDGIFKDAPEWLYDASDADTEVHASCVDGMIASYSPFYREPHLGWLQRLSYTIEPGATFLSAVKSASENAYWSWYLRARVHTYTKRGKQLLERVGDVVRPIRRDFQAANGHNMVVRGSSVRAAGGDLEHEMATVHTIESPLKRWIAKLRGQPVQRLHTQIEKWVPTGEDLELATRMSLEGYYGDYATYAPQGEGSPADFRGNVPQAIRWSGNNVQLMFMHLGSLFASARLTFNEKMGYFVNLATLASAPLLYIAVLRAVVMPFLDIPDAYASVHPGFGPFAFILALAPNFLLLSLALSGQLVVKPTEPWQRSVLKPEHRTALKWIGCIFIPPATIAAAIFLPGWLSAVDILVPDGLAWGLLIAAININLLLFIFKRDVFASLAYCILLLPFLQVLYLSWIIFGIIGCVNMLVKTQIVDPYLSRWTGTFHPPVAGRYPSDASGRFLAMNQRFPWLFAPLRVLRSAPLGVGIAVGVVTGLLLGEHPPTGWRREWAMAVGFLAPCLGIWRTLPSILDDWFLDRDSLANRWWDYWTNPQPAFVKTLKERQERSLTTLLKDNIFGILNGIFILVLILHVHFVNAADFSAALLAYLTFSIAASWIVSPFFYEEPHRTLRSQGHAFLAAIVIVGAFLSIPLGLPAWLHGYFGIHIIPPVMEPWLLGLLGALSLGAIVNLAPWGELRAFAKRVALAVIVLGLLFLNALAISYRGVAIEPLLESWALEADSAFQTEVRENVRAQARTADLQKKLERAEKAATLSLTRERLALEWLARLKSKQLPEARDSVAAALRSLEVEKDRLDLETERARFRDASTRSGSAADPGVSREVLLEASIARAQIDRDRRRENLEKAREALGQYRTKLAALEAASPGDPDARELAETLARFEKDVEQPLLREVEEAEDFLARKRVALSSSDEFGAPAGEIEVLPVGDLHAARQSRDRADAELLQAKSLLRRAESEVASAEAAAQAAQASRQASWDEKAALDAQLKEAWGRIDRTPVIRAELRDRSRHAFWTRPRQYDAFQRGLSRLRPLLESKSHREALAGALRWVAAKHWIHSLTIEGGSWYPKTTLLPRLEVELPALEAELARDVASAQRLEKQALIAIAAESFRASICLTELLARDGRSGTPPPDSGSVLAKLESAQEKAMASGAPDDAALEASTEARRKLAELEASLDAARGVAVESPAVRLARAAIETASCALALHGAQSGRESGLLADRARARLEPAQREALERHFARDQVERLEDRLAELSSWRRIADPREGGSGTALLSLLAAESPGLDGADLPGNACSPDEERDRIVKALEAAVSAHELAVETRRRFEGLEDRILGEVDRLEPYIVGDLRPGAPAADFPYPTGLLSKLHDADAKQLEESLHAWVKLLEEESVTLARGVSTDLEPARDQRARELLDLLLASKAWALGELPGASFESTCRLAAAARLGDAVDALRQLFVRSSAGRATGSRGLVAELDDARARAAQARIDADRSPGSASLEKLSAIKKSSEEKLAVEVRETWRRLKSDVEEVRRIEAAIWKSIELRIRSDATVGATPEGLLAGSLEGIEGSSSPGELLSAKLLGVEARIAALDARDPTPGELASLLASPPSALAGPEADAARTADLLADLRRDASSLAKPTEAAPAQAPPAPVEKAISAPSGETPAPVGVEEAVERGLAHAREPGGPLHLAGKDVDLATEELRRSIARFYPDFFASLGASSAAPSVFQGGGFALVGFSLDQIKNRDAFRSGEEERKYLLELAELLSTLAVLRAHAAATAAELHANDLESKLESTQNLTRGVPAKDAWLQLEGERLRSTLLEARLDAAEKKRALGALLGAPPGEENRIAISLPVAEGASPADLKARMDRWIAEARACVERRFPKDPAFQATLASLEKYDARAEEADLKRTWPALHAGAGLVAPNEGFFSVGASVIFPIVDRTADLDRTMAGSGREMSLHAEDRRTLRDRLDRDTARARLQAASEAISGADELERSQEELVTRCAEEHIHGFDASSARLAQELGGLRALRESRGAAIDAYLRNGLELAETGAGVSLDVGPPAPPVHAADPPPDAAASGSEPGRSPRVEEQRERVALSSARLAREDQLVDRFGVGAGVSYATLLIPMPSVEFTYGTSPVRRSAEASGLELESARLAQAEVEERKAQLEARLDWLRDAEIGKLSGDRESLRRESLEVAQTLERRGLEPPVTAAAARRQLLDATRAHVAAAGKAEASASAYRAAIAGAGDPSPSAWTRALVDQEVSPGAAALAGYGADADREALARAASHRLRKLAAALENKRPYGGNIGNFLSPIWDTVRLWRHRPAPADEIATALDALVSRARELEAAPETDRQAAEKLRDAFEKAKSALGGDAYEPKEVETALLAWREADIALEDHDAGSETRRRAAQSEYDSSNTALERAGERARQLERRLEGLKAAAVLGRSDPLGEIDVRDLALENAQSRARALWRYARARAEQIYCSGPLEPARDVVSPPRRTLTLYELKRAYAANDPKSPSADAAVSSRRREQELLRRLLRLRASLPVVLPSLGVDPRFGGSGLTTSMSISGNLDRPRQLDAGGYEVSALEESKREIQLEAGLEAIRDGFAYRAARERVALLEKGLEGEARVLTLAGSLHDAGEASAAEVGQAEAAAAESRLALEAARDETRDAAARIDLRAGFPVELTGAEPPSSSDVLVSPGTEWKGESVGAGDAEARKAEKTSQAARSDAEWRGLEKWLDSRIELIASLGQTPKTVDAGAGGFLAVPLSHLVGWSPSFERTEEIHAEMQEGKSVRAARDADSNLRSLAAEVEEAEELSTRRGREADLARSAYEDDRTFLDAGKRSTTPARFASLQWLEAETTREKAKDSVESKREELALRLEACGGPPLPSPRDSTPAPGASPAPADGIPERAREIVLESAALPGGTAFEIESAQTRLELLDAEIPGVDASPIEDVTESMGIGQSLDAASRALRDQPGQAALLERLESLRTRLEASRSTAVSLAQSRKAAGQPGSNAPAERAPAYVDAAWESLLPELLALEPVRAEIRAAHRKDLAHRKAGLETDLARLKKDPDEASSRADIRELPLDGLVQTGEIPADAKLRLADRFSAVKLAVTDAIHAKHLDTIAREDVRHQGRLRAEVLRIDAHGKTRRAVEEVSGLLRDARDASPGLPGRLLLWFRERQIAVAESRLRGKAAPVEPEEETIRDVAAALRAEMSQSSREHLDRALELRAELGRQLRAEAAGRRAARNARDVLAREQGQSDAANAVKTASRARAELSRELALAFEGTPAPAIATRGAQAFKARRRAILESEKAAIASEAAEAQRRESGPREWPVEEGLDALSSLLRRESPSVELPADSVLAVRRSISELRSEVVRFRMARDAWIARQSSDALVAPAEARAAQARGLLAARADLARSSNRLAEDWGRLARAVDALPAQSGAPSWREKWIDAVVARRARARFNLVRADSFATRLTPVVESALTGEDAAVRNRVARALSGRLRSVGASGEGIDAALLELDASSRQGRLLWAAETYFMSPDQSVGDLRRLVQKTGADEVAGLFDAKSESLVRPGSARDEEPAGLAFSVARFDRSVEDSARRDAIARARFRRALGEQSRQAPGRFLRAVLDAGVDPPSPLRALAALESAQTALDTAGAEARAAGLRLLAARDEDQTLDAYRKGEAEVGTVRNAIHEEIGSAGEGRLARAGFEDGRGRLLSLPELVRRDLHRARKAAEVLAESDYFRFLRKPVTMAEVQGFLDGQTRTGVEPGDAARSSAFSQSLSGRDESRTREQAFHALACIFLERCQWDPHGYAKAEMLLRPYALRTARERSSATGFHGLPGRFIATSRDVIDSTVSLPDNAAVAIAAQMHAWASGSTEMAPLARSIVTNVLLPAVEIGLASPDPAVRNNFPGTAGDIALVLAALDNQAAIEAALGGTQASNRLQRAARSCEGILLDARWSDREGLFGPGEPGGSGAESNLLCLAVLARNPRFTEARILAAVHAIEDRFEATDSARYRFDAGAFRGNWFLGGPIDGYRRFFKNGIAPLVKWKSAPELEPADAWYWLNGLLHRWSGGRLGFQTEVKGIASDVRKRGVDFTATAQSVWVLNLLGRRIEESTRETSGEGAFDLARTLTRELEHCTLPDFRHPLERGWPSRPASADRERMTAADLSRCIATAPSCHWVFASAVRRGFHPFIVGDLAPLAAAAREIGAGALAAAPVATGEPESVESQAARIRAELQRLRERLSTGGDAAAPPPAADRSPPALARASRWLEGRIDPRTGLPRTNDDPGRPGASDTYTTALAIIHWSHAGVPGSGRREIEEALRVWGAMQRIKRQDGGWADAYDARSGAILPGATNRATGPNSWMALAGLHLHAATGDARVLDQARETLDWVLTFQDRDPSHGSHGAVTLGEVPYPLEISVEANADALAAAWGCATALGADGAAVPYREAAARIGKWLAEKAWMAGPGRFATGARVPDGAPTDRDEWLDSQTWTLLALEATKELAIADLTARNGLRALEGRVTRVEYRGKTLRGFSKVTLGPPAFWAEGVAGYVLAARRLGLDTGAYLESLDAARHDDGSLPYIVGSEDQSHWAFNLRVPSIDGTLWAAWADPAVDFNPFRIPRSPRGAADPSANPATNDAATAPAPERRLDDAARSEREKTLEAIEQLERRLERLSQESSR